LDEQFRRRLAVEVPRGWGCDPIRGRARGANNDIDPPQVAEGQGLLSVSRDPGPASANPTSMLSLVPRIQVEDPGGIPGMLPSIHLDHVDHGAHSIDSRQQAEYGDSRATGGTALAPLDPTHGALLEALRVSDLGSAAPANVHRSYCGDPLCEPLSSFHYRELSTPAATGYLAMSDSVEWGRFRCSMARAPFVRGDPEPYRFTRISRARKYH